MPRYAIAVYGVSLSGPGAKSTVTIAYSPMAIATVPVASTTGVIIGAVIGTAMFLILLILIVR